LKMVGDRLFPFPIFVIFTQDGNYYDATIHAVLPGGLELGVWVLLVITHGCFSPLKKKNMSIC
jgi:hypothetical protein